MAAKQSKPSPCKYGAFCATLVVLVAGYTTQSLAAHPKISHCENKDEITFEIPLLELSTIPLHHDISLTTHDEIAAATDSAALSPEHLLAPRAEAAIRNAFSIEDNAFQESNLTDFASRDSLHPIVEYDHKIDVENEQEIEPVVPSGFNTRVPGVTDHDLSRYRKQMYRRDI